MTKKSKLILKELISVAFQLRLRMSKMLILKQIPRSSSRRTCGKFTVSNLRLTYSEQSKLLGRNGVKKICVRPSLLVLVFSSIWEFFVFLSGMNALNVKLVKGHRHERSSEAMPYSYYLTPSTLATCRPFQSKKHRLRALFFTSLREQSNPSQGPLPSSTRARSNQKSFG